MAAKRFKSVGLPIQLVIVGRSANDGMVVSRFMVVGKWSMR